MTITYKQVEFLLRDWKPSISFDIEDLNYLDEYLTSYNIKLEIDLIDLGKLYNRFSEETWAASWEDNAEGQFIEWLKQQIEEFYYVI